MEDTQMEYTSTVNVTMNKKKQVHSTLIDVKDVNAPKSKDDKSGATSVAEKVTEKLRKDYKRQDKK